MRSNGAEVPPLEGYRALDFGMNIAGPVTCQILADMGAQVIKVESRKRLDGLRAGRPIVGDDVAGGDRGQWPDLQPSWHTINRNKLSVTVNIKSAEGVALVKDLVGISDVVVDNFSPGVLERAGLGHDALQEVKRDIITVSMPAVGESGPLRDIVGYAPVPAGLSGLSSLIGYLEGPFAGSLQTPFNDFASALYSVVAVLAALRHRNLTGEGQHVELSQWEASLHLMGGPILDYFMNGRVQGPRGNWHPNMAPYNNYRCKGDDKWVSVAVQTQEEWESFRRVLGNPSWAREERFRDTFSRMENREALDQLITQWTQQRTPEEVTETLQQAGVAASPVMNIEDQFTSPHFRERQIHVECEHPKVGVEVLYGIPWRLSRTPGSIRRHAPLLGEHNDYVFGELLGMSSSDIDRLKASAVLE